MSAKNTAAPLRASGRTPLRELGQQQIQSQRKKLKKHWRAVVEQHDAEAVHKLRVRMRSLRIALQLLEEADLLDRKKSRKLRRQMRDLSKLLGRVRDLDLALADLDETTKAQPDHQPGLQPLRDDLLRQREAAWGSLLAALDTPQAQRLPKKLKKLSFHTPEYDTGEGMADLGELLVRHVAGSAIWQRYEAILRYESVVATAPQPTLHRLRIECKHLRYSLEFFQDALGSGAGPLLDTLIAMQREVGGMQDDTSALASISATQQQQRDNAALSAYADQRADHRTHQRKEVAALWKRLSNQRFRDDLAALIASL